MARFTHDGLTLWYGTEDAHAPDHGETLPLDGTITVVVQPPHPGNRVVIRYSVNGGRGQVLQANLIATDYGRAKQVFRAVFLNLPSDAIVAGIERRRF